MKRKASKILAMFIVIQTIMSLFTSTIAYANDAVMLEPLIEPNTKTYKVDIISDKPSFVGSHYETKYINFDEYYTNICKDAKGTNGVNVESLSKNPTLCTNLDSSMNANSLDSSMNSNSVEINTDSNFSIYPTNGYDFYLKAEGYKDGPTLTTDDTKIGSIVENFNTGFASLPNSFLKGDKNSFKVLTFPSTHGDGARDATQEETEYAIDVGNTLSDGLNSLLAFINNGKRFSSITELVNKSILIRPTSHGYTLIQSENMGYVIVYGTLEQWGGVKQNTSPTGITDSTFSATTLATAGYPNVDNNGNLIAYVIPTSQTNLSYGTVDMSKLNIPGMASFVWAMPKGYIAIEGIDNSLKFRNTKQKQYTYATNGQDVPWVTIHQLSMYANNAYKNHNISIATKTSAVDNGNWFITIIVEFFQTFLNTFRTILGLSDTYSLVYNKGARGSSSYNYGAMSDSWWVVVLRYHIIFQSIAWFIIICGFIKVLIDLNLSTVNPGKRMSVFETIQRFIIVGFLLVTIIPIIQFLLNMNNSIVQIFASQVDPNATTPPIIASLAGLILQIAYFGIVLYINFTYIMRSIIIGILTISSPFFISSIAFSSGNRQLFSSWGRELLANIFMQSIHAFSLAFLTNLVTTGSGLESLVVSYSIIPLTELVRTLVFQGAGSHASNLGMQAGLKFTNAAKGIGSTLSSKGADVAGNQMAKDNEEGSGFGSGSKSSGKAGASTSTESLGNAINEKMSGIKEGINATTKKQGGSTPNQSLRSGAASLGKAAVAMGNVGMGVMGLAMDMANAELSGNPAGYASVGQSAAKVAMEGSKYMGDMTSALSSGVEAIAPDKSISGLSSIGRASGITADKNNGQYVSNFKGNNLGGSKFASDGKDFVQHVPNDGIQSLANSSAPCSGMYRDIKQMKNHMQSGNSEEYNNILNKYSNEGIAISMHENGAKITYDTTFMKNSGISSMSPSNDGNSCFIRSKNSAVSEFPTATTPYQQNTYNPQSQDN